MKLVMDYLLLVILQQLINQLLMLTDNEEIFSRAYNRVVYLIVRIQIVQQIIDTIDGCEISAMCCSHCFNSFMIWYKWFKW